MKRHATQIGDERRAILARLERATDELERCTPLSVFATSANVRVELAQAAQRTATICEQLVSSLSRKNSTSICGRTSPCDVLAVWRERSQTRRARRAQPTAASAAVRPATAGTDIADLDPKVLDRLEAVIRASGDAGISAALLEPNVEGDPDLLRRALDSLRTDGRIELTGRGRGTRYRVPTNRLF